jgi:hypothetical protein
MELIPFNTFFTQFILWSSIAFPQEDHYVFSNLDINYSLSENRTKCIIRERNGFVWLGTSSGLNRYDAKSVTFEVKE